MRLPATAATLRATTGDYGRLRATTGDDRAIATGAPIPGPSPLARVDPYGVGDGGGGRRRGEAPLGRRRSEARGARRADRRRVAGAGRGRGPALGAGPDAAGVPAHRRRQRLPRRLGRPGHAPRRARGSRTPAGLRRRLLRRALRVGLDRRLLHGRRRLARPGPAPPGERTGAGRHGRPGARRPRARAGRLAPACPAGQPGAGALAAPPGRRRPRRPGPVAGRPPPGTGRPRAAGPPLRLAARDGDPCRCGGLAGDRGGRHLLGPGRPVEGLGHGAGHRAGGTGHGLGAASAGRARPARSRRCGR